MSDYLQYGGQAVVEGVMMRSPRFFAVACRKPDQSIIVRTEPIEKSIVGKLKWLNRPFLRGTLALVDAMALGIRALTFAAQVQTDVPEATQPGSGGAGAQASGAVEEAAGRGDLETTGHGNAVTRGRISDIAIGATMVSAFAVGLGLFVALPTALTQLSQRHLGISGPTALNAVDGLIRITIFLVYIGLIGRMQNIRRVFEYHGAEHKAINTLESGEELTLENSLQSSRIHPRCGTSFIIVVLLASIVVHSLFPRPDNYLARVALHLSLIPVVAGLAYEVIRLAGKFRSATPTRILLAPGLWSQQLTTREPQPDQVEVALAALNAVLEQERGPAASNEPAAAVA